MIFMHLHHIYRSKFIIYVLIIDPLTLIAQSTAEELKFSFIKRVDKGWTTTVKDLESWCFERYALISGHLGGLTPGGIRGNGAGFADFCSQCLARDGGIGRLLHFRGKIHGEKPVGFVTSPLQACTTPAVRKSVFWSLPWGCYCLRSFKLKDLLQLSKYLLLRDKIAFHQRFFTCIIFCDTGPGCH